jgi:hypothetical protein
MIEWFFNLFRPKIKTVQELADRIGNGNFEKLGYWLEQHIWYQPDQKHSDEWKPAIQTLTDRAGDCEDFAVLAYSVLKLWGVKDMKIISVHPFSGDQIGHVILAVKDKGIWYKYSNGEFMGSWTDYHEMIQQTIDDCKFTSVGYSQERGIYGDVYDRRT